MYTIILYYDKIVKKISAKGIYISFLRGEFDMKYLVILTDGAAGRPMDEIGGKTALEAARMECTDDFAARGEVGMVRTVPEGMAPGSDVANLSVMGYAPEIYHTGRSPLEAASMGIELSPDDVAFRCNLITVSGEGDYEDLIIKDHSSGDISNEEAAQLIYFIDENLGTENIRFYPGVSYRHAMIVHNGSEDCELTPPHDVLDQKVGLHLPKGNDSGYITDLMKKSYALLKDHPVNTARMERGLNPANTIWIWGQGRKPSLTPFREKYGISGTVISAVDLIKGIAICAGLESVDVEGATGTIRTNFEGKAQAAVDAFRRGSEFVYIHLEAPDECSHQGSVTEKIESLELIDRKIVRPVTDYLKSTGEDFRLLVLPDHPTPVCLRTHSPEPVPYVLYDSRKDSGQRENRYTEACGRQGKICFEEGHLLTDHFFRDL